MQCKGCVKMSSERATMRFISSCRSHSYSPSVMQAICCRLAVNDSIANGSAFDHRDLRAHKVRHCSYRV